MLVALILFDLHLAYFATFAGMIHPWAKTVMLTSSKIVKLLDGYVIGHELLSVKLLKDMSKSSKAENKGEKE